MTEPLTTSPFDNSWTGPTGGDAQGNPFAETFTAAPEEKPAAPFVGQAHFQPKTNMEIMGEALAMAGVSRASSVAARMSYRAAHFMNGFAREVLKTLLKITKQAVQMALFKFAIEACAMTIKSLLETMTGMQLTPPNIDTKGIFYNLNGDRPQTTTQTNSGFAPRSDNPFGFSAPAW